LALPEGSALAAQAFSFGSALASGYGAADGGSSAGAFAALLVSALAQVFAGNGDETADGLFVMDTAGSRATTSGGECSGDLSGALLPAARTQLAAFAAAALAAAAAASVPLPASASSAACSGLAALPPAAAVQLLAASRWCLDLAAAVSASASPASATAAPLLECRAALRALRVPYAAAAWLAQSDATLGGPSTGSSNSSSNSSSSGSSSAASMAGAPALAWALALPAARWRALASLSDAAFSADAAFHDGVDDGGESVNGDGAAKPLFYLDVGGASGGTADEGAAGAGNGAGAAELAHELTVDLGTMFLPAAKKQRSAANPRSAAKKSARKPTRAEAGSTGD
jgi:hypothetical protein